MLVGLAGGYCAGKDAVARLLAARGFTVIDVDAVGHEVLSEKAPEVIAAFGEAVRGAGGSVDRKALGRIVFARPSELARLEGILHPPMVERVVSIVGSIGGDILINAAVLFRMGLHSICNAVICVTAPALVRALRAVRRDGLPFGAALRRVFSQRGIYPKSDGAAVDTYYIRNWGTVRSLERSVERVLGRLGRGKAT
jgi:dephospho-CoA kinase